MSRRALIIFLFLFSCGDNGDDFSLPQYIDVAGTWEGSATFTNNCENPACEYPGTLNPPSIVIELEQSINILTGTIPLNLPNAVPQFASVQCQSLTGTIGVTRAQSSIDGTQVTLTQSDFQGVWNLQIVGTSGPQSSMQGFVTNSAPGCTGLVSDNVSLTRRN